MSVAELAEHCNLSTRQLQRQFQDVVGVSAKTLARSIRFEEVRNHDFREFADRTPSEFAREMRSIQAIFRDRDNVVFLQAPSTGHR